MKFAYHDIILPDGRLQQGPIVVETDDEGNCISWHLLEQEEPFTQWIGGTYTLNQTP